MKRKPGEIDLPQVVAWRSGTMISVIIPAYNVESCIDDCLRSVLTQENAEFEVIIVNDGSEDQTGRRCREWAVSDARITYIEQENQGQGSARNSGIRHAKGDWLVFLDADDELVPGALDKLRNATHGQPDIVSYEFYLRRRSKGYEEEHITLYGGECRCNSDLLRESSSFLWDKMFRTEFWRKKAVLLEDVYGEDFKSVCLLEAVCEKFALLREPLILHYEREDSLSRNPAKVMEITKAIEDTMKAFIDRNLLDLYKVSLFYLVKRQYELYQSPDFCSFGPGQLEKIQKELRRIMETYFGECSAWEETIRKSEIVQIGNPCRLWYGDRETGQKIVFPELEKFLLMDMGRAVESRLYLVNLSQEGRCIRFGTRTAEWQKRRWEELTEEFADAVYGDGKAIGVLVYDEPDSGCQELCRMLVEQEGICGIRAEEPMLEALLAGGSFSGESKRKKTARKVRKDSERGFWCRGEQYRLQCNENLLNAWLMLKNRNKSLEGFFIGSGYRRVAVYGMGYLGERLLEELAICGIDAVYGIDKGKPERKDMPVYAIEEEFPEADVIVVTVVHLFFEIQCELAAKTDIPVVSLEEIIEVSLRLSEEERRPIC